MSRLSTPDGEAETRFEADDSGSMDWLVDDSLVENAGLTVARMTLAVGAQSRGHRHPNCSEVIHLIAGAVEQQVGSRRLPMTAGDTVFIPAGHYHQTTNTGDREAAMIVCYSAGTRIYQAEPKERASDPPGQTQG